MLQSKGVLKVWTHEILTVCNGFFIYQSSYTIFGAVQTARWASIQVYNSQRFLEAQLQWHRKKEQGCI